MSGAEPGGSRRLGPAIVAVGLAAATVATVAAPTSARKATVQDWPPFVLVAGLLLVGLVAADDGVFAAAGGILARAAHSGVRLFVGAVVLIVAVTAVLNLDTSVAFLTPVLIATAAVRGEDEAPLLYACLLLSNAGSLLLPGANLTNLIVLGHLHLTGHEFFVRMAWPCLAAVVVTATVVGVAHRHDLRGTVTAVARLPRPRLGLGAAGLVAVMLIVLVTASPALPVAAVGVLLAAFRIATGRETIRRVRSVLGAPVLVGLFGTAVALGTLGREWSFPATMLSHLDQWSTALVAAGLSVLVNNLPAASMLAATVPPHPDALLVGLNVGPNLFVTGSLAWILWWRAARTAGSRFSVARAIRLGAISAPLAGLAAVAVLTAAGSG